MIKQIQKSEDALRHFVFLAVPQDKAMVCFEQKAAEQRWQASLYGTSSLWDILQQG